MKKYFYLNNEQKLGPFTYDELWNQKISPETMVWSEGMQDWKKANTIHEFANWFPKQTITQKRAHQPQNRQQPNRQQQNRPIKQKKSNRGIIGISIFIVGVIAIFYFVSQANSDSQTKTTKQVATEKSGSQKKNKIKKQETDIKSSALVLSDNFTIENYPLQPDLLGNEVASFLGIVRTSFSDAKLLYMDFDASNRFQNLTDTYSETAIKVLFSGVIPIVKYQSMTSALIIFYNPWNDLVLLTDWHLIKGELFICDLELVTADYLEYDGLALGQLTPLWARTSEIFPIEALTNSLKMREDLFDDIWGEITGTGSWRKLLVSLHTPELLVYHQEVVAFRLRDQYLNLKYLTKGKEMKILRKPVLADMKKLHSPSHLNELIQKGPNTPKVVSDNMAIFPPETWEKASVQTIQKVPEGAFVFITTPKLTKTFLSFYYTFNKKKKLELNRIDWCTFDNEL